MKLVPSATDLALAEQIHNEFSRKPGAQLIASQFALGHLAALITELKPKSVMEFGAGIGTITKLLLIHPTRIERIVSTEDDAFCLKALEENLPPQPAGRWQLVTSNDQIAQLPNRYDLVIFDGVDGVLADERQYDMFRDGVCCFVEGNRQPTREALDRFLAERELACTFDHYRRKRALRVRWRKASPFPFPVPKVSFTRMKGCHVGRVTARDSVSAAG